MKTAGKKNSAASYTDVAGALAGAMDIPIKPEKPPKLKTSEITIRRGHKKGYIAKHHLEGEDGTPHHKTHEYPLQNMKDLQAHLTEHMAEREGAEPAADPDALATEATQ